MKVNTKVRYGLRALLEIALHNGNHPLFQKNIAKNQKLSEKYLDPIIAALKTAGLIVNAGGKKSGYILKKEKNEITMYDVYRTFEPELSIIHCINKPVTCFISQICVANEFWLGMNNTMVTYLKSTTLADLVERHKTIKHTLENANTAVVICK